MAKQQIDLVGVVSTPFLLCSEILESGFISNYSIDYTDEVEQVAKEL